MSPTARKTAKSSPEPLFTPAQIAQIEAAALAATARISAVLENLHKPGRSAKRRRAS